VTYAENTSVPAERSRGEIERTLERYGADGFSYGWIDRKATVAFRADGRMVRFDLEMPTLGDFSVTDTGRSRSPAQTEKERDKAVRQRWRALLLVIKAKLEAVESGITSFEAEFLAHILLPDGSTVAETALPGIAKAYETGKMPKLLGAGGE